MEDGRGGREGQADNSLNKELISSKPEWGEARISGSQRQCRVQSPKLNAEVSGFTNCMHNVCASDARSISGAQVLLECDALRVTSRYMLQRSRSTSPLACGETGV